MMQSRPNFLGPHGYAESANPSQSQGRVTPHKTLGIHLLRSISGWVIGRVLEGRFWFLLHVGNVLKVTVKLTEKYVVIVLTFHHLGMKSCAFRIPKEVLKGLSKGSLVKKDDCGDQKWGLNILRDPEIVKIVFVSTFGKSSATGALSIRIFVRTFRKRELPLPRPQQLVSVSEAPITEQGETGFRV